MTEQQFLANALAMRIHVNHDNERLRDALRTIAVMAEHCASSSAMTDIARIARNALIAGHVPNPSIQGTQP